MQGKRVVLMVLATLLVSGAGVGGWTVPAMAYERDVADVRVFYEPLAPYGTWITVEEYGQVWRPRAVPRGWRPYTHGRWVYTDDGWMWVSAWEWGWAPFHYGRWSFSTAHGWFWVPDTVWAPAWVAWRHSSGWVGWAPLPPKVTMRAGIGLSAAHIDVSIAPLWFSFVSVQRLLAPRVHVYLAPPARNVHLVRVTKHVTNYVVVEDHIINRSIDVKHIERVIKRPVVRHRVVEVDDPEAVRRPRVKDQEHEVVLVRPAAAQAAAEEARERRARQAKDQVRAPRKDDRPGPLEGRDRGGARGERRRLDESHAQERAALEARQRQERQSPPEDVTAAELRKRHQAERHALQERVRQETQELRKEQERRMADRPKAAEAKERRERRATARQAVENKEKQRHDRREQGQQQPQEEQQTAPPTVSPSR
jgi:hypothetical protein